MKLPYENLARGISFYANYRLESSFSFFTDESRDLWRFARGRGRTEQRRILCVETRLKRADEHLAFQHRGCCKCSALNGIYRPVLHTRFANKLIHYKRSRVFIHPPSPRNLSQIGEYSPLYRRSNLVPSILSSLFFLSLYF